MILKKKFLKKIIGRGIFLLISLIALFVYWMHTPILPDAKLQAFDIMPGRSVASQLNKADVPVNPVLFMLLARVSGKAAKLQAGSYELQAQATPWQLLMQLANGETKPQVLAIIEGWTFHQMRQVINAHPALKHDTAALSDQELLALISADYKHPEGIFFPDTYLFAKGMSDLQIYRQAHAALVSRLSQAWDKRDTKLPYKTPYEALIMASIIEKETGHQSDRAHVAAVFVNRLNLGMLLQTDPTVIYGMGKKYRGNITRRDLITDTPYNTYTRAGLPPTPIALPGADAIRAAFSPAATNALYFVARGDGRSQFSSNLQEHNQAVRKFILGGR